MLGAFDNRANGGRPVPSYVAPGRGAVIAGLRWLHEFTVRNRLEGDAVLLKVDCRLP